MTDLLLEFGVSNLLVSVAIALVAWTVQRAGKHPRVAHFLWLILLVKLVTPPLLTVAVVPLPGPPPAAATSAGPAADLGSPALDAPAAAASSPFEFGRSELVLLWLLGSAGILVWSLVRVHRFNRLLGLASESAAPELTRVASELARRLGLGTVPQIKVTSAHLSPMVWWIGGKVRVLIPAALTRRMEPGELRLVLAHELAHVKRGDHLVRWLEWLSCVIFWWNPVAWIARLNLRANEEICCDALVLERMRPNPHTYGSSLLNAVEFLAGPALRAPAMASELDGGGFLERRFRLIVSAKPIRRPPRWLTALLLLFAVAVLPVGLAGAQDPDHEAGGDRIGGAVRAGELPRSPSVEGAREVSRRNRFREEMAAVKERIWAAVKEGRISEEDADLRWNGYLESLREHKEKPHGEAAMPGREEMGRVKEEIWAAVKDGRISEEDATLRWEGYLESLRERKETPGGEEAGEPADGEGRRAR